MGPTPKRSTNSSQKWQQFRVSKSYDSPSQFCLSSANTFFTALGDSDVMPNGMLSLNVYAAFFCGWQAYT
eukprot:jgi/Pico_ML_1/55426/g1112.t1